ncbi:hypothetical protein T492DRAFT_839867 [Pavlovales sp. CCMP2436]|nr:hypothetical protein T492DRAFT_839867 [Pavlovales sp. CCMP2436]
MPSQIRLSRINASAPRRTRPYNTKVKRRIEIFTELFEMYGQGVPALTPNSTRRALVYTDTKGKQRKLPSTQMGFEILEGSVSLGPTSSTHSLLFRISLAVLGVAELASSSETHSYLNERHSPTDEMLKNLREYADKREHKYDRTYEPQPYVNDDGSATLETHHMVNPFGFMIDAPYNTLTTYDHTTNPLEKYRSERKNIYSDSRYVDAFVPNGKYIVHSQSRSGQRDVAVLAAVGSDG